MSAEPLGRETRKARKRERARQEIIDAAGEVLVERGIDGFTLDEVASRLGLTKPAIYYYFKSKRHLLQSLVSSSIGAESAALCAAIEQAKDGADALKRVIAAFVAHHRRNLGLFRLMYMHGQIFGVNGVGVDAETVKELVHPHTVRFYDALEAKLLADRDQGLLAADAHPRRLAFNTHAAALGIMTMIGLAESVGDPLKHSADDLVGEMARTFAAAAHDPVS